LVHEAAVEEERVQAPEHCDGWRDCGVVAAGDDVVDGRDDAELHLRYVIHSRHRVRLAHDSLRPAGTWIRVQRSPVPLVVDGVHHIVQSLQILWVGLLCARCKGRQLLRTPQKSKESDTKPEEARGRLQRYYKARSRWIAHCQSERKHHRRDGKLALQKLELKTAAEYPMKFFRQLWRRRRLTAAAPS